MGKVLGLDIGVASVGWGIIDLETSQIVDAGVRLFQEADKENNEKRRGFRSGRRLKRRRVTRIRDLEKLLKRENLYTGIIQFIDPYEARCKGLTEKMTLEELNRALFHLCKHRGSALEIIEDGQVSQDSTSTKSVLADNDALLQQGKYVCEIQLQRIKEGKQLRGIQNNFRSKDYQKELCQLLQTQGIEKNLSQEIMDCILRRRDFSEGPGSFKSPTIYGRIYNEDGTVKVGMIEKMTGRCSIYPDELRAPKLAPSAEFFNLLNDLNNLRIDEEPLEVELKQKIVHEAFAKGGITPKQIEKLTGIPLEDITGFRIDKEERPLLTKLEGFKALRTIFSEHGNPSRLKEFELLDKIAEILTKTKVKEERIAELGSILEEDLILKIAELNKFTGYHSLSLKALNQMNEELYHTQLNQMQILQLSNLRNSLRIDQKGKKNISIQGDAILSPVAMRSYRQTIKVVNAVRRRYGEMESIVVETTRAKNSAEEKKRINEAQKYFKKMNDEVDEILKAYPGIKANGKLRTKIRLYQEQGGKSAYTQQTVDLDRLIQDPAAYEIDHIIPISISLDDSINNKVLTTRLENQEKGQLTPVMAFERGKFSEGSLEKYRSFCRNLYVSHKISLKKYRNYTYANDISRYENMKEFVARNLVDTSYANRLVFNTLMDYFKDNGIATTVHTIKGSATSAFRKRIKGLEKDRELDYSHHAIDALIVASIKKLNLYRKLLVDFQVQGKDIVYRKETGEVIDSNEELLLDEKYMRFLNDLVKYNVRNYSHRIDTKPNRSIADQTIYSTRNYGEGDLVVKKYKNIYDPKFTALAEDILNEKTEKYLIARNDPQTFEKIKQIVFHYYEQFKTDPEKVKKGKKEEILLSFNPLAMHLSETGEKITKFSKKDKGPIITSLKYTDGKLGIHVDITQNYEAKDKKVVLQQISPYRTDFYWDDGKYKFVTIRYANVEYSKTDEEYFIKEEWYKQEKRKKKIQDSAEFCFSLHRNELIEITDEQGTSLWKFTATNNDTNNVIEVKPISYYEKKQIMLTIGGKIKCLRKFSCDPLGKCTESTFSPLKLRFK